MYKILFTLEDLGEPRTPKVESEIEIGLCFCISTDLTCKLSQKWPNLQLFKFAKAGTLCEIDLKRKTQTLFMPEVQQWLELC